MSNGWNESAAAWIEGLGERGDFGREFVLDRPMLERVQKNRFQNMLDVGCGEGRFCRLLQPFGIQTVGIDPTEALIVEALRRDSEGDYRLGQAEALNFPDSSFDLVVSYLSLIDIADTKAAISEMARVLKPGGTLLIANLSSYATASPTDGWTVDHTGKLQFTIDHYLEEKAEWVEWRGIRIQNWHRPLTHYMQLLLSQGLTLKHFDEPAPYGGSPDKADRYRRVPYFVIMEWHKP